MAKKDLYEGDDNAYGAKTFTLEDSEVLDYMEMIADLFDFHQNCPWINISEFQKFYDLLEKGYNLSAFQVRRISNAHLLAKNREEKIFKLALEMRDKYPKEIIPWSPEETAQGTEKINPFSAFEPG